MREEYQKELDELKAKMEAAEELAEQLPYFKDLILREKLGVGSVHLGKVYKGLYLDCGINRNKYNSEEGKNLRNYEGDFKGELWSIYINTLSIYDSHEKYGLGKLVKEVFYYDVINTAFYAKTDELMSLLDALVEWKKEAMVQLKADTAIEELKNIEKREIELSQKKGRLHKLIEERE
jgi:hypothetical protein